MYNKISASILFFILFINKGFCIINKHPEEKLDETYDFIIIGGGTAGCILANRLSEIKQWKILLLEAGEQPNYLIRIPALAPSMSLMTSLIWNYTTKSQTNLFKSLKYNEMRWITGKSLGGSSAINYMIYSRGNPDDYNQWEKTGLTGWSYNKVLPYFLKSEGAHLDYASNSFHNKIGPQSIEYSYMGEAAINFLKGIRESGYNMKDYNSNEQLGFSNIQGFLKNGARYTINDAYLEPIKMKRKNLNILTSAIVTKITFDKANRTKGVKFIKDGRKYRVLTNKEVILAAGPFNSAKILLLSGIGPKEDLDNLQIPLIKNLQGVGKNLQDHITYLGLNFNSKLKDSQFDILKNYITQLPNWLLNGKGILTSLGGSEAIGFIKLPQSPKEQNYPDIELIFINSIMNNLIKTVANFNETIYQTIYNNTMKKIRWSIYPILLHPKSMGWLKLKSKNPNDPPELVSNFLTHPDDLKKMIQAIKFVIELMENEHFKKFKTVFVTNSVPNCKNLYKLSDKYWECALRNLAITANDPFGTCRMGQNDQISVVDRNFKVFGVEKLRIIDSSVIPTTISGHLQATVMMLAEKGADLIKDDY